jgi:hypothetical protein
VDKSSRSQVFCNFLFDCCSKGSFLSEPITMGRGHNSGNAWIPVKKWGPEDIEYFLELLPEDVE